MSLQLWLPLNGNLDNQGLSDLSFKIINPNYTSVSTQGKIGSCYVNSNYANGGIVSDKKINLGIQQSMFCWVKINKFHIPTDSSQLMGVIGNHNYSTCTSMGLNIKSLSATTGQITVSTGNGTGRTFNKYCNTTTLTTNTWYHIGYTYDGNKIRFYLNGKLDGEHSITDMKVTEEYLCLFAWAFNGANHVPYSIDYQLLGALNDVRVYDHCLSPKEVKEISKGLILHYPLSSPYDIGFANKYSSPYSDGSCSVCSNAFTKTKLKNERGYNYKLSHTGNGNNHWPSIMFPNFNFTAGKRYQYSCKVRLNKYSSTAIGMEMRGSRVNNDWGRPSYYSFNSIPLDGKWHTLSIGVVVPATFDLSGTTKTAAPLIEFYTASLSVSGMLYEMDFDLKDVQVVECDGPVEFIENEFLDNTIYDTSGYKNNGIQVIENSIKLSSDSPRGENCYIFNGTNSGIYKIPTCLNSTSSDFSISFWYKPTVVSNGAILNCRTLMGEGVSVFWVNQRLRFDTGSNALWNVSSTLSLNTWYHIVFTRNGNYKRYYVNGVLKESTATPGVLTTLGKYMSIGISSSDDVDTLATCPNPLPGNLSDFRIYATCLSDSDIQELYNKPISIDNQGVMFAVEAVEETATGPQFNKTGAVEATTINALPLHDMETKVLDDGSAWARILHHNNRAGTVLFTASNVLDIQTTDLYSRLKILEQFRDDNGAFEFMVIQPDIGDTIYRWKQTNNPTRSGSLSGYVNIENGSNGLVYGPNGYALMSEGGVTNNWWCAVGAQQPYNGGIPGFGRNTITGTLDFYVRIDTVSPNKEFKIYNKYIECNDIIEY